MEQILDYINKFSANIRWIVAVCHKISAHSIYQQKKKSSLKKKIENLFSKIDFNQHFMAETNKYIFVYFPGAFHVATGQIISFPLPHKKDEKIHTREKFLKHYCQGSYIYLIGFTVFRCCGRTVFFLLSYKLKTDWINFFLVFAKLGVFSLKPKFTTYFIVSTSYCFRYSKRESEEWKRNSP